MTDNPAELSRLFRTIEATVIRVADKKCGKKWMSQALRDEAAKAKESFGPKSDDEYFKQLVHVIFYSGFRATTVSKAIPTIDKYFSRYASAADYDDEKIDEIMADTAMIRNKRKIKACIANARVFRNIVRDRGSFFNYLSDYPKTIESACRLRKQLLSRGDENPGFEYLGKIISFHYLMDLGYPVLKPDLVIVRIFARLRLVDVSPQPISNPNPAKLSEKQLCEFVRVGSLIAAATGEPIRYVDLVFVVYGQEASADIRDLPQGICLGVTKKSKPKCYLCEVKASCQYTPKTELISSV